MFFTRKYPLLGYILGVTDTGEMKKHALNDFTIEKKLSSSRRILAVASLYVARLPLARLHGSKNAGCMGTLPSSSYMATQ